MSSDRLPDWFAVLGLPFTPAFDEKVIRNAYRKLALRYHPDKNLQDPLAKQRFHVLTEAYTVLSNEQSFKRYCDERRSTRKRLFNPLDELKVGEKPPGDETRDEFTFFTAFEDILRDVPLDQQAEGVQEGVLWKRLGGISGAILGFIVANVPGAVAGMFAGQYLGGIRDKHQKSVLEVYQGLPIDERLKLLAILAGKLAQSMAGGSL